MLASYYDNPSSNPTEVYNFSVKMLVWINKIEAAISHLNQMLFGNIEGQSIKHSTIVNYYSGIIDKVFSSQYDTSILIKSLSVYTDLMLLLWAILY